MLDRPQSASGSAGAAGDGSASETSSARSSFGEAAEAIEDEDDSASAAIETLVAKAWRLPASLKITLRKSRQKYSLLAVGLLLKW
jgi:hypothetical protein